jgi:hypothetical protein
VAHVNGHPIPLALVEREVRLGRSRDAVLRELIDGELFYERALSMGYLDDPVVVEAHQRIMVRRYLELKIEDEHLPADIDPTRVREFYQENQVSYRTPELRAAAHLLVKPTARQWDSQKNWEQVPKPVFDAARQLAEKIRADVVARGGNPKSGDDLEVIRQRWAERTPKDLDLVVERLPPSPRRPYGDPARAGYLRSMVEPFADGMFGLRAEGDLSQPVDSYYGTHLIVLTRVVPEWRAPEAETDASIREHLASEDRRLATAALLMRLLQDANIRVDDSTLSEIH